MQHFDPVTGRLVLALARDGSIAKTAERESIAPSAISRRVADLEARLGVVLFDRSASGVSLTPAGENYAEHCRRIFREIADLHTSISRFASGSEGQLRIAASSSALSGRLPELLALYAARHPRIRLDIREMPGAATLVALEDAQVDLGIFPDNYNHSNFEAEIFEDDDVGVIAPPDHPLAVQIGSEKRIAFEDAVGHEIVGVHHLGALDRLINEAASKAGRTIGRRVNVEGFPALVRMVEAGFGIGFLRNSFIHLLAGTDLVHAPLSDAWAERKLIVARRRNALETASVTAFFELARQGYGTPATPTRDH